VHYTRFEKARIVGARALQIAMGAPLLIKKPAEKSNPVELALLELHEQRIPMTVKREGKIIKGPVV
jgi:DNA-directed RNA polymerase subunit K